MTDEKTTAEPSGASGGSLACRRRQNIYKTAKSIVMEAQDMDTVTALRTLNYSAEKLADLISGGLDDPQVRMAVRAACLRELAWVDKLLEEPTHWMALPSPPTSDK